MSARFSGFRVHDVRSSVWDHLDLALSLSVSLPISSLVIENFAQTMGPPEPAGFRALGSVGTDDKCYAKMAPMPDLVSNRLQFRSYRCETGLFLGWHPSCSSRGVQRLHLTIVTGNPETLDGLELYVRRAGAAANGTRRIGDMVEMTPEIASAVVLFPDDFEWDAVVSALTQLRTERPKVLPVVVTSHARRFELLPVMRGGIPPLVIPKPVWGWKILDSIRARLDNPEASVAE